MERHCWLRFLSVWSCILGAIVFGLTAPAPAIEENTAARPIGGADIRSAVLPRPGLYGGIIGVISPVHDIKDGSG
jgi:hypothetical protein